jgi:hypothetical protein
MSAATLVAVDLVQLWHEMLERLSAMTQSLEAADIPYALIQNRAVDYWYSTVGEEPHHTTSQCEILVRRVDLPRLMPLLQAMPWKVTTKPKAVLVHDCDDYRRYDFCFLFTGENVHKDELLPYPPLRQLVRSPRGWVMGLESVVNMLLARHRTIDKTHLFDMITYGLIDRSWRDRLPDCLQERFDATYTAYIEEDDIKRGLRNAF